MLLCHGAGHKKKGYRTATLLYIFLTKTGLPYDYSLSHQLLFNTLIIICATNMEIVFPKSKQNDKFG
jgi:hypothetical protein